MDEELNALFRLSLTKGIGPTTCRQLLERFGSAQATLMASEKGLLEAGLAPQHVESLKHSEVSVEEELRLAQEHGVKILTWNDKDYPHNLRFIYDPPPLLYVKGGLKHEDSLAMAIVGSRLCSYYGQSQAERFARVLGRAGFTIVSGLARGIDTSAHLGALKAGARTVAVMGCGLASIYPRENAELAEKIGKQGAIVSELPMRTPPDKANFPPRNRLISGLSLGVVVIEAGQKSGSLVTARWALEQGKEVFALPGQIDSPYSRGTHKLIKEGAKLVEDVSDILEELGPVAEGLDTCPEPERSIRESTSEDLEIGISGDLKSKNLKSSNLKIERPLPTLNPNEEKILSLLSSQPRTIDEITESSGLPAHVVSSNLTMLELKKLVKQLAGKRFVRG
ncbi:MAG TPA: DNA-processing protein DprA [Candidatus Hypogeohydataceae bacterium YC41]